MHIFLKRFLCAGMLLLLMLSALPAQAANGGVQAYVKEGVLTVYKSPNVLSKSLGTMAYGQGVQVTAWRDGWARVQNGKGATGYCALNALTRKNPNTLDVDGYVRKNGGTLFTKPGTTYQLIAVLSPGTKLHVLAVTPDRKWARARYGKKTGYIHIAELSKSPDASADEIGTVWIVSNNAVGVSKDRKGNFSNGSLVSHGQRYALLETAGDRCRIRNGKGRTGWVPRSVVSTRNPNTLSQTMYAQVSGNALYPNSILKNASGSISRNEKLTVVSTTPNGGWSRVKKGNKYYYVLSLLLDDEKAPEGGRTLTCTADSMNLYPDAKTSESPVARLKKGDTVQLTGIKSGHLKVKTTSGATGYCAAGGWAVS